MEKKAQILDKNGIKRELFEAQSKKPKLVTNQRIFSGY